MNKPMYERKPAWKKPLPSKANHYMTPLEVIVINNDVGQAYKVLEKKMSKEGVLAEIKKRRAAEKPSEEKRRKHREAIKKARRALNKKRRSRNFFNKKRPQDRKEGGENRGGNRERENKNG